MRCSRETGSSGPAIGDTWITPAGYIWWDACNRVLGGSVALRVAVIGSGPAGIYTAEALVKQSAEPVEVDVLERLPTPYGLVRYGVAPDHTSIKSIANYLRKVLEHPGVRFLGGVELGGDITRDDLLACYDAVIYATGAMVDRHLGVPGEDLPGSVAAT